LLLVRLLAMRAIYASVRLGVMGTYMIASPPAACTLCGVPGCCSTYPRTGKSPWSSSTGPSSTFPITLGPPSAGMWPKGLSYTGSGSISGSPFCSSAKSGCSRWKSSGEAKMSRLTRLRFCGTGFDCFLSRCSVFPLFCETKGKAFSLRHHSSEISMASAPSSASYKVMRWAFACSMSRCT